MMRRETIAQWTAARRCKPPAGRRRSGRPGHHERTDRCHGLSPDVDGPTRLPGARSCNGASGTDRIVDRRNRCLAAGSVSAWRGPAAVEAGRGSAQKCAAAGGAVSSSRLDPRGAFVRGAGRSRRSHFFFLDSILPQIFVHCNTAVTEKAARSCKAFQRLRCVAWMRFPQLQHDRCGHRRRAGREPRRYGPVPSKTVSYAAATQPPRHPRSLHPPGPAS